MAIEIAQDAARSIHQNQPQRGISSRAGDFVHPPCANPDCRGPVERRTGERPGEWRERQTCSLACKGELNSLLRMHPSNRGDHPPCIVCPNPVPRRPGEQRAKWMARKTCSEACVSEVSSRHMARVNTKRRSAGMAFDHPACANPECGRPVEVRADETPTSWRVRKTCSEACRNAVRSRQLSERRAAMAANRPAIQPKPQQDQHNKSARHHTWKFRPERRARPTGNVETVEQALARGLTITRCPPAYAAPVAGAGL